jgi:hypothetical protein
VQLTRKEVIRRFQRQKPKNADEALRKCRVPLTYLAEEPSGVFSRSAICRW